MQQGLVGWFERELDSFNLPQNFRPGIVKFDNSCSSAASYAPALAFCEYQSCDQVARTMRKLSSRRSGPLSRNVFAKSTHSFAFSSRLLSFSPNSPSHLVGVSAVVVGVAPRSLFSSRFLPLSLHFASAFFDMGVLDESAGCFLVAAFLACALTGITSSQGNFSRIELL